MTNLKDMIIPMAKLSYLCTLAPFVLTKGAKVEYVPVGTRPFYLIRIVLIILIMETTYFLPSEQNKAILQQTSGVIVVAVNFVVFYIMLLGFPLYLIATYLNSSRIADFMNNMERIGAQMEEIGLRINFRQKYRLHLFQMALKLCEMLLGTACFVSSVSDGTVWQTTIVCLFSTPFMLTYLVLIQWTTFVNLLTMHFRGLNQLLKTLKYRQCFVLEELPTAKRKPLIEVIEACGSLHDQLCDESKRINEAYAWQILYLVPHYFLITLSGIYHVLLRFKNEAPFSPQLLVNATLAALYAVELVVPCALCKEEADRFSEILNKVDLRLRRIEALEDVVTSITLQTYHQRVEFSVFEIFPLDGTVLYSMISAWTTYIVILLQFDG